MRGWSARQCVSHTALNLCAVSSKDIPFFYAHLKAMDGLLATHYCHPSAVITQGAWGPYSDRGASLHQTGEALDKAECFLTLLTCSG